jgi:hypothetical protein
MQKSFFVCIVLIIFIGAVVVIVRPAHHFDTPASIGFACRTDAECVLVKSTLCGAVSAINRQYVPEWVLADSRRARSSSNQKICPEAAPGIGELTNYVPTCEQARCTTIFNQVLE